MRQKARHYSRLQCDNIYVVLYWFNQKEVFCDIQEMGKGGNVMCKH